MEEILNVARAELERFLSEHLPSGSPSWWRSNVVDRLTFSQQRFVEERRCTSLAQLDLAALLRVLDQNWFELSERAALPREARSWVKELQSVRNKWAHRGSAALSAAETYRDVDTVARLLGAVGVSPEPAVIEIRRAALLAELAPRVDDHQKPSPTSGDGRKHSLFSVGEIVTLRSDSTAMLPIIEVLGTADEHRYRVFQNGTKVTYYESQLQALAQAADVDRIDASVARAYLTSLHLAPPSTTHLYSLGSGRITFVPYQYRPVLKLIHADRPRLLIADEVGVGKTIEAALILKELRARMDLASVLVICPKALVAEKKWYRELKRFDEQFATIDGDALRYCLEETDNDGVWPEQYGRAIMPYSLFDRDLLYGRVGRGRKRVPGLLQLDPPPRFDLVIVDEAHAIRNPETFAHQAVRYFCDNAQAVLFLTATPIQLGDDDLFSLLNVLRPDLIIDRASFAEMAAPNPFMHSAVAECRKAEPGWPTRARTALDGAGKTPWGRRFLQERPDFQQTFDELADNDLSDTRRVALIRRIEELGTFSGLINRTRRRDIGNFTTRKAETVEVEFTAHQREFHDRLLGVIARILAAKHGDQNVRFLMTTIRRQAASCLYGLMPLLEGILARSIDQLTVFEAADTDEEISLGGIDDIRADITAILDLAKRLDRTDPKIEAFVRTLREKTARENPKVLVFSTFRHTLAYLAARLEREGFRAAVVHGDVDDEVRADLRQRFGCPTSDPEAIDILLSSEVGSEGLDFQFCDCLVNYDLPWNPMRVEQRIGRLDRYGQQSETVAIVNLITPGTVDADIYERCLLRIGVFEQAIGGSEEILGAITKQLHEIAERFDLTPEERARRFQQLADNDIRKLQEEQELESKQSQLFGLALPDWEAELEAAGTVWLRPDAIEHCIVTYLRRRLPDVKETLLGDSPVKTLRLNQEARALLAADAAPFLSTDSASRDWDRWLRGGLPTLAVTFDQSAAADRPDVVHLSPTHPLVRQAAAHFTRLSAPVAHLRIATSDLAPGRHRFAIYRWSFKGVRADEKLVVVADAASVEDGLLPLLATAEQEEATPPPETFDDLDARHHAKWSEAQASHAADNRQLVEYKMESLSASHRARRAVIEDQIARTTNERIQIMKRSELARADADYQRHLADLERAASAGDIHAAPVLFGTVTVVG